MNTSELVRRLKDLLVNRSLPEDIWTRELKDRIVYFSDEIDEFYLTDLFWVADKLLVERKSWIILSDHVYTNLKYWRRSNSGVASDYYNNESEIGLYEVVELVINDGKPDPFKCLIEELCKMAFSSGRICPHCGKDLPN